MKIEVLKEQLLERVRLGELYTANQILTKIIDQVKKNARNSSRRKK